MIIVYLILNLCMYSFFYAYNFNMKKKNMFNALFTIFLPIIVGSFMGLLLRNDYSYLESLNRTIILPPILFSIVWSILYILMGIYAYYYEKDYPNDNITIGVYYVSLVINILFSFILFSEHLIVLSFIDVLVLFILILYLFMKTLQKKKKFAYLLLPYILWLILALTLMLDLLIYN